MAEVKFLMEVTSPCQLVLVLIAMDDQLLNQDSGTILALRSRSSNQKCAILALNLAASNVIADFFW